MLPAHSLYKNKYITEINRYRKDPTQFRPDQIYERLWALKKDHILWSDIPPGFEDHYALPHRNDYGIDTLNLEYTESGQVKMYGPNSLITWKDMTNYHSYSTEILGINKLNLLTTPEAKIDKMVLRLFSSCPESIQRNSFEELLSLVPENIEVEENTTLVEKIEERPYNKIATQMILDSFKEILLVQLPCGSGKTFLAANVHLQSLLLPSIDLFVTPWTPLARQTVKIFQSLGISCGLIGDGETVIDKKWKMVVCITASLHHLPKDFGWRFKFGDEGHHLEEKPDHAFFAILCHKTILLSATFHNPKDVDFILSKREAIDGGWIADYKIILPHYTGKRIDALLKMIKENADWIPIFVYFNTTKKTKDFSKLLNENNITSEFLIGGESDRKRESIKSRVLNGLLSVVCLCGVWNEGESIHNLRTIIFGDLRHSSINERQVAQRGSRIHPSKPFYNIVLPIEKKFIEMDGDGDGDDDDDDDDDERDDLRKILQVFVDEDPILRKRIEQKSYSQVVIKLNNELIRETEEENDESTLLYNKIFNSLGEMINDMRMPIEEKIQILIDDNKVYSRGKEDQRFPDGSSKAIFWTTSKNRNRCLKNPYNRLVLESPSYKEDWERFMREKEKSHGKPKCSIEEKIQILIDDKKVYSHGKEDQRFPDGSSKALFWTNSKKDRCSKEPYNRLILESPAYKEDWERFMREKEKSHGKPKCSIEEKIQILIDDKKVYSQGKEDQKFPDGSSKAIFWTTSKKDNRCSKEPYNRLILESPAYKEDWETYTIKKEAKNSNKSSPAKR